jgi:DNA-binding NarL/FixJ family response regulator
MDLRLPDMSGIAAAVSIQTEFPEARIIILTTFDSDTDRQRAAAAGVSAFVLKGGPPRELLKTIHQVHAG